MCPLIYILIYTHSYICAHIPDYKQQYYPLGFFSLINCATLAYIVSIVCTYVYVYPLAFICIIKVCYQQINISYINENSVVIVNSSYW